LVFGEPDGSKNGAFMQMVDRDEPHPMVGKSGFQKNLSMQLLEQCPID